MQRTDLVFPVAILCLVSLNQVGAQTFGEVFVIFGGPGRIVAGFDLDSLRSANGGDGSLGFVVQAENAGHQLGKSLGDPGDANGDALPGSISLVRFTEGLQNFTSID